MSEEIASPNFMVGLYDNEGDLIEAGVFLCFDGAIIKVSESVEGYKTFTFRLMEMITEISEHQ